MAAATLLVAGLVGGCTPAPPQPGAANDASAGAGVSASGSGQSTAEYRIRVKDRDCDLYLPPGEVVGQTIECGYVEVPWDRHAKDGQSAELAFVILRATGNHPRPDAIVHVAGGPGAGATLRGPMVEFIKRYAALRSDHDIVIYDQRGMGSSLPYFDCGAEDGSANRAAARKLHAELGRRPTGAEIAAAACELDSAAHGIPASQIGTQTSAADLADLIAGLGYPGYDLYGVSYGARLVMALMHFHPDLPAVRAVVLDSPYPLPEDRVNHLAATAQAQYRTLQQQLLGACGANAACASAYPDLATRYDELVAKLAKEPLDLPDGTRFTAEDLQRQMFPQTPSVGYAPYLPRMIAELEAGRAETLLALRSGAVPESRDITATGTEDPRVGELVDAFQKCKATGEGGFDGTGFQGDLMRLWDAPPATVTDFLDARCTQGTGRVAAELVRQLPAGSFNSVIYRFAPDTIQGVNPVLNTKLLCTEEYPFAPTLPALVASLRQAGLPEYLVAETANSSRELRAPCAGWGDRLDSVTAPGYGKFPVLILSGDLDANTPPAFARIAAEQLPHASLVRVPTAGHSILGNYGPCPTSITASFLDNPARQPDSTCANALALPWVMPGDALPALPK